VVKDMEKLTTGQMLDKLGLNDIAVNQNGYIVGYTEKGDLITWNQGEEKPGTSDDRFTFYYPWVAKDEWVIQYHFVSFEEAMYAFKYDKKDISFHQDEELIYHFEQDDSFPFTKVASDSIQLREMLEGKWVIEN